MSISSSVFSLVNSKNVPNFWRNISKSMMDLISNINKIFNQVLKVHIFWEGHKILQNLHLTFVLSSAFKSKVEISQNFVAFSEYMNFTKSWLFFWTSIWWIFVMCFSAYVFIVLYENWLHFIWVFSFFHFGHISCVIFFTMCSISLFFLARFALQDKQQIA